MRWFFQAHANLKLVSDQSESDRSETQLKIWSGPHCHQKTLKKAYFQCARYKELASQSRSQECKRMTVRWFFQAQADLKLVSDPSKVLAASEIYKLDARAAWRLSLTAVDSSSTSSN